MNAITKTKKKIPEDLATRYCVVVNFFNEIEFDGTYEDCLWYMRMNMKEVENEDIDLRFATKDEYGNIEMNRYASFVL